MVRFVYSFAALALAVAAMGCSGSEAAPQTTEARPESATGPPTSAPREVELRVDSGSWGVFALADVFIDGKGPFTFTIDTGASTSIVDWDLVRRLGIETAGKPLTVTGIACRGEAARIRVTDWRVGDVVLPAKLIQTIDMPDPGGGIHGLLGSDVLSTFGSITVDYDGERLLLTSTG